MEKRRGWVPVYWTGSGEIESLVKSEFPSAVFHDETRAIKSENPVGDQCLAAAPIADKTLARYSKYENTTLKMMDRMAANDAFLYSERNRHYHRLVRYWLAVINEYKPDVVLFPESPHMVYDYVINFLCVEDKIRTVMFESMTELGLVIPVFYQQQAAEMIGIRYTENMKGNKLFDDRINEQAQHYFDKLNGDHALALRPNLKNIFEHGEPLSTRVRGKLKRPNTWMEFARDKAYAFYLTCQRAAKVLKDDAEANYVKIKNIPPEDKGMTALRWKMYRWRGNLIKHQLKRQYERTAVNPDYSLPYIYFPLQYQPEKTSCPEGGYFVYQNLLVEMIAGAMPKSWKVYVKENPAQFKRRGEHARSKQFYSDIEKIRGVQFVHLSTPPFDLIDNAKAIVTIRGTAGWEALIRGKPVLVTGYPLYRHCKGAYAVNTIEDCRNALNAIENGETVQVKNVILFLKTLCETGHDGYIKQKFLKNKNLEENAIAITSAICSVC